MNRKLIPHILRALLPPLAALTFAACSHSPASSRDTEIQGKYLENLNTTIKKAPSYHSRKETRLDSIKATLSPSSEPSQKWDAYVEISENYRQMDVDSAIVYASKALELKPLLPDSVSVLRGELAHVDALSTAGAFPPALRMLDSLQTCATSVPDKVLYWKAARRCFAYIMSWGGNNHYYDTIYRERYAACDDSLLCHLPEEDLFRKFIYCERLVDRQRWGEARTGLEELLQACPQESNIYGMAAYQLAQVYRNNNDVGKYVKYLALAAESDIKGAVREGLALPSLANWAYEQGDIDNAFRYANYTLEDANSGNIRMRANAIAPIIPLIDSAVHRKSMTSRNQMIAYMIVTTVLFIATIILLVFAFSSLKKRRLSQEKLEQSTKKLETTSKKLESYVGNFIGLCSNYAARLDQMSKLVTRKIAAGQSDDLVKMISSGKFGEDSNVEFYRLIDKALLDIFPDFVAQINSLLQPDKRIVLNPDEPLSPELRIYAFVRLGVDQSNRIAQILGYSANTVYAYRNRMRNRAVDRENFDSQVASLP